MNKGPHSRLRWMDAATRGIRFGPDRAAVRRELTGHLEDKIADLKRIFPGMTDWEAEQRALAQMGDAEEIGREMARIHKPWLGYLWRFSQVLLGAVVLLLVSAVVSRAGLDMIDRMGKEQLQRREFQSMEEVLYEGKSASTLSERGGYWCKQQLALYEGIDQVQRLGEATVTLSRAAHWKTEEGTALHVQMSIAYDKPWEKSNLLAKFLCAQDDLGNHYGYVLTIRENGAHQRSMGNVGVDPHWDGYTWNLVLEGVPQQARWVRFSYGLLLDSDFSFVIDLNGEVEP